MHASHSAFEHLYCKVDVIIFQLPKDTLYTPFDLAFILLLNLMDTAPPWPQNIGVVNKLQVMESNTTTTTPPHVVERKARPQRDEALNCPRCNSSNTKFCYYNNYSLTQPRYFCKTCRRYWTEGGSLRNVPVGGGSRKNKKASKNNVVNIHDPSPSMIQPQIPKSSSNQGQDLNLGYALPLPIINNTSLSNGIGLIPSSASQIGNPIGELSLSSGGNFVPLIAGSAGVQQHAMFSRGFSMQEFMKPNFHFFPMEGMKPPSDKNGDNDQGNNSNNDVRAEGDSSSGCSWNGMFGGGSPWELGRY